MTIRRRPLSSTSRRLIPLYIAAFLQGFVLWYAIEKLFMRSIGFTDATIGLMAAAYATMTLLIETPSGIIADRWSRKGVLMIAGLFLTISSIVCGLSTGVPMYIIGALLWGIFFALYSGINESVIYDTLQEETGTGKGFELQFGRMKIVESAALIGGALFGGALGQIFGLRPTYFLSALGGVASIVVLLKFREPKLHKAEVAEPIMTHINSTFRAVFKRGYLVPIVGSLILVTIQVELLYEFNQLWLIALATPVALYGIANGLIYATYGAGGAIAAYTRLHRPRLMLIALIIMTLSTLLLILSRSIVLTIAAQFIFGGGLTAIIVVFAKLLHDELPSRVRAGAASAVSTVARIALIPLFLIFGYVSDRYSVFIASCILLGLMILAVLMVMRAPLEKASPASPHDS